MEVAAAVLEQVERDRPGRQDLVRPLGEVVDEVDHDHDLHAERLLPRLPPLAHDQIDQVLRARDQLVAKGKDPPRPLTDGQGPPVALRDAGPGDGRAHLLAVGHGDLAEHLAGGGVAADDHRVRLAVPLRMDLR
jgi:hypothetical protein